MRSVLLATLVLGSGCQLYWDTGHDPHPVQLIDAQLIPDAGDPPRPPPPPPPPPPTYSCEMGGDTCSVAGATEGCPAEVACGGLISVGECACGSDHVWSCEHACADQLCSATAVQAALVGTWEGTIAPPSFSQPWTDRITIGANGQWSGTCVGASCLPFYYGGHSGTITVQAQTNIGAFAAVDVGFDPSTLGQLRGLRVTRTSLRFTFIDAWLDCSRVFRFDLHRVP